MELYYILLILISIILALITIFNLKQFKRFTLLSKSSFTKIFFNKVFFVFLFSIGFDLALSLINDLDKLISSVINLVDEIKEDDSYKGTQRILKNINCYKVYAEFGINKNTIDNNYFYRDNSLNTYEYDKSLSTEDKKIQNINIAQHLNLIIYYL